MEGNPKICREEEEGRDFMGWGAVQTEAQGYECVAVAKRNGWVCRDYLSPGKGF